MKRSIFLTLIILLISACNNTRTQIDSYKVPDQNISNSNQVLQNADNQEEIVESWDYCGNYLKRLDYQICLSNELKNLEKSLDEEYSKALKRMQEFTKKGVLNLTDAQKKWDSYREANCQAEEGIYGEGTDAVGAGLQCYLKLTKERKIEIKRIYGSK